MNEIRIIKKYPNRRLYDTMLSCYITLEDVKILVQDRVPIQIIEARTKKDITHMTLIYLIVEQENSDTSLFNSTLLEHLIRLYADCNLETSNGKALYELVTQTLSNTVSFLSEQRELLLSDTYKPEQVAELLESAVKGGSLISIKKKISAKIS